MQVVSMTEARNNFKAIFDAVYHGNDEVIIHRKGRENVVVIPFDEYSSMKETSYLLSNQNNAKHLLESIKQLREGKGEQKELIECN
ncbi:MAG: prevent-host-death protein [Sulfurimonas sp. RIFCSPHIGHO2_12_FULL_36_9]|uniref:type II toxin-antitoxin system Phd/YefM family antitoxin n=1 Tax=Sulfurimonas sp. RIFCSPLOWO2_12_36_12 TaxID=1802253 RepID=UPI0008CF75CF|nr:type II toxin-antitoxin system prevent-host-death family antitoxin [Sulfurimonas sp. RIFCSPLOWO2_12_36_12]OHD96496.1 MAG: prevent-host-death protein [Sulfurimonas sp. RIFCSPHIGHO2_12_FULL_36_9]OHE00557.1 MAG: prevent-host-death protein [Sulfurimonas sp. RIFCSPLOWO2_12_36_12]